MLTQTTEKRVITVENAYEMRLVNQAFFCYNMYETEGIFSVFTNTTNYERTM